MKVCHQRKLTGLVYVYTKEIEYDERNQKIVINDLGIVCASGKHTEPSITHSDIAPMSVLNKTGLTSTVSQKQPLD